MSSIVAKLQMDMAHRCLRPVLTLVHENRLEEALEVADLAIDCYLSAVGRANCVEIELFAALAMRAPHPSEKPQGTKQA